MSSALVDYLVRLGMNRNLFWTDENSMGIEIATLRSQ